LPKIYEHELINKQISGCQKQKVSIRFKKPIDGSVVSDGLLIRSDEPFIVMSRWVVNQARPDATLGGSYGMSVNLGNAEVFPLAADQPRTLILTPTENAQRFWFSGMYLAE
jgi:hypothetical protein